MGDELARRDFADVMTGLAELALPFAQSREQVPLRPDPHRRAPRTRHDPGPHALIHDRCTESSTSVALHVTLPAWSLASRTVSAATVRGCGRKGCGPSRSGCPM
jgi:hypothetical protein